MNQEERNRLFLEAIDALDEDRSVSDSKTFTAEMDIPPGSIHVGLFPVVRSNGGRSENEYKINVSLPGHDGSGSFANLDGPDGYFEIMVGYDEERDVFVLWDEETHDDFSYNQTLQVFEETLNMSSAESLGVQPRDGKPEEIIITAEPSMLKKAIYRRYKRSVLRSELRDLLPDGWDSGGAVETTVIDIAEAFVTDTELVKDKKDRFELAVETVITNRASDESTIENRYQNDLWDGTEADGLDVSAVKEKLINVFEHTEATWKNIQLSWRLDMDPISVNLPESLYFPRPDVIEAEINAALAVGKHIIFTGPPGTGKSVLAKQICEAAARNPVVDGYNFTTATADWTNFDTIGGLMPNIVDGNEEIRFEPRLFLNSLRDKTGDLKNEWILIDELNRADIDKAFGPLFSVLSNHSVTLPYERNDQVTIEWVDDRTSSDERRKIVTNPDRFPLTPSWRLVGTMNTLDKTSLYDLSYAFMRRFRFIHIGIPELIAESRDDGLVIKRRFLDPESEDDNYISTWTEEEELNETTVAEYHEDISIIWSIVNQERAIGPSIIYDMLSELERLDIEHNTALSSVVVGNIFPQLEGVRDPEDVIEDLLDDHFIVAKDDDEPKLIESRLDSQYLREKARSMLNADV